MPKGVYHICAVTPEPDRVRSFLRDVVGIAEERPLGFAATDLVRTLGWPDDSPDTSGALVGSKGAGRVEVIGIPPSVQDRVAPGIPLASFAIPEVEAAVALCRAAGYEVTDPVRVQGGGLDLTGAVASVGGLTFELIRFGPGNVS